MKTLALRAALVLFALMPGVSANAADIGRIKVSSGPVHIERGGQRLAGAVDTPVLASDTLVTGANAQAGVTFADNTRAAIGQNSVLSINRYTYDPESHSGRFDATIQRGTLGVVSGRINKTTADAMTVRTPTMVMGVRGTEFVVEVPD